MYQGFVLNNDQQLEALKKYCKKVIIDLDKGPDLPDRSELLTSRTGAGARPKLAEPRTTPQRVFRTSMKSFLRLRKRWRITATGPGNARPCCSRTSSRLVLPTGRRSFISSGAGFTAKIRRLSIGTASGPCRCSDSALN